MIGESSGVPTLINNERIARENQVRSETREDSGDDGLEQSYTDVTSFSPQALALARNIAPAEASAEENQTQSQGRGQDGAGNSAARFLDIRI